MKPALGRIVMWHAIFFVGLYVFGIVLYGLAGGLPLEKYPDYALRVFMSPETVRLYVVTLLLSLLFYPVT